MNNRDQCVNKETKPLSYVHTLGHINVGIFSHEADHGVSAASVFLLTFVQS